MIALRKVVESDLPTLYAMQCDPESNRMAVVNPRSEEAFYEHWKKCLPDPAIVARVIVEEERIVGLISCFKMDGVDSIGYWIMRDHWGRGIASEALKMLLNDVPIRPLHARAATSNTASIRVLTKCGFEITGTFQETPSERYPACEVVSLILQEQV